MKNVNTFQLFLTHSYIYKNPLFHVKNATKIAPYAPGINENASV